MNLSCLTKKTNTPYDLVMEKIVYVDRCQDPFLEGCDLQTKMDNIRFLQQLTDIYPNTDLSVIGPMNASDNDILLWTKWLENHRNELEFLNDATVHIPAQ